MYVGVPWTPAPPPQDPLSGGQNVKGCRCLGLHLGTPPGVTQKNWHWTPIVLHGSLQPSWNLLPL